MDYINARGRHAAPYRKQLQTRRNRLDEQSEKLNDRYDEVFDKAQPELDALTAKSELADDTGETPSLVETLTMLAARADLEVATYTRNVAADEIRLEACKLYCDRDNLDVQIAHLDQFVYADTPIGPSMEHYGAIFTLHAQETALDLAHAEADLRINRQRLEHATKMQAALREALRLEQKAEEIAQQEAAKPKKPTRATKK